MSLNAPNGKVIKRADPSTIQDKFMVGYQGWFTCPGDGAPLDPAHHGWLHWCTYPIPDGGRPNTDLWPDVSDYSPEELYPVPGLNYADGSQAYLFSSRHPKTVQRHFNYMAKNSVDGAFLQRFLGQCYTDPGNIALRNQRDEVGDRVKEAAEKEGRVYAIMYDVTGVSNEDVQQLIQDDWVHLMRDKHVLNSPNYLKEKGKPVIALWGFGLNDRNHNPATVRAIANFFRTSTPGGAYLIGGGPAHWRKMEGDADRNPEFLDIWLNEFDAISPWTIGRYGNEDDADRFAEDVIKGDVELLKKRADEGQKKVDYMPVVLPGGSGYNMSEGQWGMNDIKRNGGKFLWKQIHNARRLGVRIMYGAMWDEYDEGTAYLPVVQTKRQVPVNDKFNFIALDVDGYDLPSDWYMRICGLAAEGLRGERRIHDTFPSKELQDYWSSRPRYEDAESKAAAGGSGGGGAGQGYSEWAKSQGDDKDEPPPPPYSLEAMEEQAAVAAVAAAAAQSQPSPQPVSQAPVPNISSRPESASQGGPPVVDPSSRPTPQHSVSADELADDFLRQSSISQQAGGPPQPGPRPLSIPSVADPNDSGAMLAAQEVASPGSYTSGPGTSSSSLAPGGQSGYFSGQPQTRPPRKGFPSQTQLMHQYNSSQSSVGTSPAQSPPPQSPPAQPQPIHQPSAGPVSPGAPQPQSSQAGPSSPPPPNRPSGSFSPQPNPQQQQQQHRPQFPIASGALDFAFNAVGTYAGDERRKKLEEGVGKLTQTGLAHGKRLEEGVGKLTQTGTKLFNKFTK